MARLRASSRAVRVPVKVLAPRPDGRYDDPAVVAWRELRLEVAAAAGGAGADDLVVFRLMTERRHKWSAYAVEEMRRWLVFVDEDGRDVGLRGAMAVARRKDDVYVARYEGET